MRGYIRMTRSRPVIICVVMICVSFFLAVPAIPQDRTMFPAVRGMHHMIGAGNPMEVEAGYRILEQGGNAIDAGVAAVFAATVTEQDHICLGGEMPLLVKVNGKPVVVIS